MDAEEKEYSAIFEYIMIQTGFNLEQYMEAYIKSRMSVRMLCVNVNTHYPRIKDN